MELEDIWGNEIAKRATEIAEAGNHSIKYIGNGEAELFYQYCKERHIEAYIFKPCLCGNLGDETRACGCEKLALQAHWRQVVSCVTDLTVKTHRIRSQHLDRVRLPYKLDTQTRELLRHAVTHMHLGQVEIVSVLSTARTIATVSQCNDVKLPHLAEALQYIRWDGTEQPDN